MMRPGYETALCVFVILAAIVVVAQLTRRARTREQQRLRSTVENLFCGPWLSVCLVGIPSRLVREVREKSKELAVLPEPSPRLILDMWTQSGAGIVSQVPATKMMSARGLEQTVETLARSLSHAKLPVIAKNKSDREVFAIVYVSDERPPEMHGFASVASFVAAHCSAVAFVACSAERAVQRVHWSRNGFRLALVLIACALIPLVVQSGVVQRLFGLVPSEEQANRTPTPAATDAGVLPEAGPSATGSGAGQGMPPHVAESAFLVTEAPRGTSKKNHIKKPLATASASAAVLPSALAPPPASSVKTAPSSTTENTNPLNQGKEIEQ